MYVSFWYVKPCLYASLTSGEIAKPIPFSRLTFYKRGNNRNVGGAIVVNNQPVAMAVNFYQLRYEYTQASAVINLELQQGDLVQTLTTGSNSLRGGATYPNSWFAGILLAATP